MKSGRFSKLRQYRKLFSCDALMLTLFSIFIPFPCCTLTTDPGFRCNFSESLKMPESPVNPRLINNPPTVTAEILYLSDLLDIPMPTKMPPSAAQAKRSKLRIWLYSLSIITSLGKS
jgi:hypothetical protein